MHSFLAIFLVVVVLLLCLMQTILVIRYSWFHRDAGDANVCRPADDADTQDHPLPKTAVVLCLRGEEESTPDCIAELVGQDYPEFELHIAFDSQRDPAVAQVRQFFDGDTSRANLHFFEPKPDCSYKCAGITHVLEQLDSDIEFVAFCDGDAIVDTHWLRDLVRPMLQDPQIGATTGNRWFSPYQNDFGALVRKHWNAAAVVQMQAYDIAWGGSMCLPMDVVKKCGLVELWSTSFCEDTRLGSALRQRGLTLYRVPNLIIENRETTTLARCFDWVTRQLLTVRLHHPDWPYVLAHGIATGLASVVTPLAAVVCFASGSFYEGRSLLVIWVIYQILNFVLLKVIEHHNRKAIGLRRAEEFQDPQRSGDGSTLALLGVQLLHPLAAIFTALMRKVSWRGVSYSIVGDGVKVLGRK